MAVGENGVTLHDLERTMLSLDRDKNLNDGDREFLMKGYKEERMRYMDSLFAFTEEHRQRLEEVEKLYLEAVRRLEAVVDRMTRREVQKRKQGVVSAKWSGRIWKSATWRIPKSTAIPMRRWTCGVSCVAKTGSACCSRVFNTGRSLLTATKKKRKGGVCRPACASPMRRPALMLGRVFTPEFRTLKDSRKLAWEDLMRITRFDLTVRLRY